MTGAVLSLKPEDAEDFKKRPRRSPAEIADHLIRRAEPWIKEWEYRAPPEHCSMRVLERRFHPCPGPMFRDWDGLTWFSISDWGDDVIGSFRSLWCDAYTQGRWVCPAGARCPITTAVTHELIEQLTARARRYKGHAESGDGC